MEKAARACCDFYIQQASALDGICYWDTGAPQLHRLGDWQAKPADPYNDYEPVDASASAIAAQGLLRLGHLLGAAGEVYTQAGLTVAERAAAGTLSLDRSPQHEGLLLHSIYHRPNGWDYIPPGAKIPCGEVLHVGRLPSAGALPADHQDRQLRLLHLLRSGCMQR